jgi:hypothetical protein
MFIVCWFFKLHLFIDKDNVEKRQKYMVQVPLNRTKPKKLESLYSFLHRLALVNHFEHFGSMFSEIISAYDENCNEIHEELYWVGFISEFLTKLDIDIKDLTVNQFDELLVREEINSTNKRVFYRKLYHRYSTKYCPDCINEDFYHRIYWDVSYATICTKHKKEFITKCSKCGEFIRLSRLMRNACRCGMKYTELRAKEADSVSLEVQMVFQEFLFGEGDRIERNDQKWLTKDEYLDFSYLFSLLIKGVDSQRFSLSSLYHFEGDIKKIDSNIRKINLKQCNLIVNTLHFLTLYPTKDFTSLIDAISEIDEGLSYTSRRKCDRYRILNEVFTLPKGVYYYEIYTEYLNSKVDEYISRRFSLPPMVVGTRYMPIYKAIKLLKTEYTTLMNLCNHNLLKLHTTHKNGKQINLIERDSVEKYQAMKNSNLTLSQAMEYLGLNFQHLKEVIRVKLIEPTHGPSVDDYSLWYIPKKEIYRFEEELKGKFLSPSSVKGEVGFTIKQVCLRLYRYNIHIGEVYQLIFNDRLRVFNDENTSLVAGIKIPKDDVRLLGRELYYKRIEEKGYLGKEILRACKVSQETLKRLLNEQVLKIDFSVVIGTRSPMNYIKKEQVINYLNTYKGMGKRQIAKHLKMVETLFEPKV